MITIIVIMVKLIQSIESNSNPFGELIAVLCAIQREIRITISCLIKVAFLHFNNIISNLKSASMKLYCSIDIHTNKTNT